MDIGIKAIGYGLASILGAGSILLVAIGNANWGLFLMSAIIVFIMGKIVG